MISDDALDGVLAWLFDEKSAIEDEAKPIVGAEGFKVTPTSVHKNLIKEADKSVFVAQDCDLNLLRLIESGMRQCHSNILACHSEIPAKAFAQGVQALRRYYELRRTKNEKGVWTNILAAASLLSCQAQHQDLACVVALAQAWEMIVCKELELDFDIVPDDRFVSSLGPSTEQVPIPSSQFERYQKGRSTDPLPDALKAELSKKLTLTHLKSGYVYVYNLPDGHNGHCKIGYTSQLNGVNKRLRDWRQKCGKPYEYAFAPGEKPEHKLVPCAHKVEKLVHIKLREFRRAQTCSGCGAEHNEWFMVEIEVARQTIEKWSRWMRSHPYGGRIETEGFDDKGNAKVKIVDATLKAETELPLH